MFRGCTFEEQQVNSKNDGGLYQAIFPKDGILWGCEMTVTNETLTIQPGELIIAGRVIPVDGATQIPFTGPIQNGYGQIVLTIDLSKTATKEEFEQIEKSVVYSTTTLFPELTQGKINTSNGDMIYQQELAVVSIAGGNITGISRQMGDAEIDAEKLNGKYEDELSVANSEKLGGHPANYYAPYTFAAWEGSTGAKLESGISADANLIWRDGDTVHVNLLLRGTLNNGWALATLPAACPKPDAQRNFIAVCRKTTNAAAYYVRAQINTAGVVSLLAESGDGGVYSAAAIEVAYPVK